tara:strand:+ start:1543 stop:2484 length:942 start_codon:yes stop_codon:yes gene_type:complete
MTATITTGTTVYNPNSGTNFRTLVKDGMSTLGISGSDVVYDSGNVVIFKISNGTGTYADTYHRYEYNGNTTYAHSLQIGTGWTSGSDVTGAGVESGAFYGVGNHTLRTIKADDGSFGIVQIIPSGSSTVNGCFGFVKPTTTSETAANIPLVIGVSTVGANGAPQQGIAGMGFYTSSQSHYSGSGLKWRDSSSINQDLNSFGNMRLVSADVKRGAWPVDGFGQSPMTFGGSSSSSQSYMGAAPIALTLGFDQNLSGNVPVVPNAIVKSGGSPIGYNSNLGYTKVNQTPGDSIIVTAGTEEWYVLSADGMCIRKV